MAKLPGLNRSAFIESSVGQGPNAAVGLESAKALGELGRSLSSLGNVGFDLAARLKKSEDDEYILNSGIDFQDKAGKKLDELKIKYPDGKGITEEYSKYMNDLFNQYQKDAPSEMARKNFEFKNKVDLLSSVKRAELFERDGRIRSAQTAAELQSNNISKQLLLNPNEDFAISSKAKINDYYNEQIANGTFNQQIGEAGRKSANQAISKSFIEGRFNKINEAKSFNDKKAMAADLMRFLKKDGPLAEGVTPAELDSSIDRINSLMKQAKKQNSIVLRETFKEINSQLDDNKPVDDQILKGTANAIRSDENIDDVTKAEMISQMMVKNSLAKKVQDISYQPASEIVQKMQAFTKDAASIRKGVGAEFNTGIPESLFGQRIQTEASKDAARLVTKMVSEREKQAADFYTNIDSTSKNYEQQVFSTENSPNGLISSISPSMMRAFSDRQKELQGAADIQNKKLLTSGLEKQLKEYFGSAPADQVAFDLNRLQDSLGAEYQPMMTELLNSKGNKLDPKYALAAMAPTLEMKTRIIELARASKKLDKTNASKVEKEIDRDNRISDLSRQYSNLPSGGAEGIGVANAFKEIIRDAALEKMQKQGISEKDAVSQARAEMLESNFVKIDTSGIFSRNGVRFYAPAQVASSGGVIAVNSGANQELLKGWLERATSEDGVRSLDLKPTAEFKNDFKLLFPDKEATDAEIKAAYEEDILKNVTFIPVDYTGAKLRMVKGEPGAYIPVKKDGKNIEVSIEGMINNRSGYNSIDNLGGYEQQAQKAEKIRQELKVSKQKAKQNQGRLSGSSF